MTEDSYFKLLEDAMSRAYAPYSKFRVGAVVRGESGQLYAGANVENAAYPQGWCAEASALAAMVMGGETTLVRRAGDVGKSLKSLRCLAQKCCAIPQLSSGRQSLSTNFCLMVLARAISPNGLLQSC